MYCYVSCGPHKTWSRDFGSCANRNFPTDLSAMWTVADFLQEVNATSMLLKARSDEPSLVEGLGVPLAQKLEGMLVSTTDLVSLYEKVKASELPDTLKAKLVALLDSKAMNSMETSLVVTSTCQQFDSIAAYLTGADIQHLETTNSFEGAHVLAARCKAVGVSSIKETTKKIMVCLLLCFEMKQGKQRANAEYAYKLAHHVKWCLDTSPVVTHPDAAALKAYPLTPSALPKKHFAAAYGDTVPVGVRFPEMASLLKEVFVRNTALALRGSPSAPVTTVAVATPTVNPVAGHSDFVAGFEQVLGTFIAQAKAVLAPQSAAAFPQTGVPHDRVPLPNGAHLTFQQPAQRGQATQATVPGPAPLPVSHTPAAPAVPLANDVAQTAPPEASPAPASANVPAETVPKKSLEEYEKESFETLKNRKAPMKRPAAAKNQKASVAKAKAKAKVISKTAGSKPSRDPQGPGCPRCRGNTNGCSLCLKASYNGIRCHGREAWKAYVRSRGKHV